MDFPKRKPPTQLFQSHVDADLLAAFRSAAAAHGVTIRDAAEFGLKAFVDAAAQLPKAPTPRRRA